MIESDHHSPADDLRSTECVRTGSLDTRTRLGGQVVHMECVVRKDGSGSEDEKQKRTKTKRMGY